MVQALSGLGTSARHLAAQVSAWCVAFSGTPCSSTAFVPLQQVPVTCRYSDIWWTITAGVPVIGPAAGLRWQLYI